MLRSAHQKGAEAAVARILGKTASALLDILGALGSGVAMQAGRAALTEAAPKLMGAAENLGRAPVRAIKGMMGPQGQLARAINNAPLPPVVPGKPRIV
jgi:hypothetical protein